MAKEKTQNYELVPYEISKNNLLQVTQADETVWLTQKQIAQLFNTTRENITIHLKNIFQSGELDKNKVCKKNLQIDNHALSRCAKDCIQTNYYNLDVIISVGYRVNSKKGVQFRQWATQVIKDKITTNYKKEFLKLSELCEKQQNMLEEQYLNFSEKISNQNYLIFKLEERQNCLEGKNSNNISVIKHVFEVFDNNLSDNRQSINYLEKRISILEKKLANARRKTITVLTV